MNARQHRQEVEVSELADDQLGTALLAGVTGLGWSDHAAVDLVVSQRTWLGRWELRQAVEVVEEDGLLYAWLVWNRVAMDAPASSGELRILDLARSLGGVPSSRPLSDLLAGLDDTNLARVVRAMEIAARGPSGPPPALYAKQEHRW